MSVAVFLLLASACAPTESRLGGASNARATAPPAAATEALRATRLVAADRSADAEFGYAVAGDGDLDGDGYDDVAIGAHQDPEAGTAAGAVYVTTWTRSGPGPQVKLLGSDTVADDRYGAAVALLPDLDGDGADELAVGAWGRDDAANNAGAVYLYPGSEAGPDMGAERKLLASDAAPNIGFGTALAAGGDTDGDGLSDLAVGAPSAGTGAAYLYTGPGLDDEQALTPDDGSAGDTFGSSLGLSGDLDGDGYDDLVVGAPGHDPEIANAGAAYVFSGGATGLSTGRTLLARSPQNGDNLGKSVAIVGDVDGDGFDDLAVGAHQDDDTDTNSGAVHLYWGRAEGVTDTSNTVYTAPEGGENAFFGIAVARVGDVDQDGADDMLVGGSGATVDGVSGGAVWLFYGGGSTGFDRSRTLTLVGTDTDGADRLGRSVSGAGDLDGDGFPDLLAGAYTQGDSPAEAGAAYAFVTPCADRDDDGACAADDCDDADPSTFPGAAWAESDTACMTDADGDGWGSASPAEGVEAGLDCVDGDADTFPAAASHEPEAGCTRDADGDGWGDTAPPEGADPGTDCLDDDASVHPGSASAEPEAGCTQDADGDGWGSASPADGVDPGSDCDDGDRHAYPGAAPSDSPTACLRDQDGDGWGAASPGDGVEAGSDCDDEAAEVHPAAVERCNGLDDDCDGTADGASAREARTWQADADGDGWTDPEASVQDCEGPDGYLPASYLPDCDDTDPAVSPGQAEIAGDGVDQDCDGADLRFEEKGCSTGAGPAAPGLLLLPLLALGARRRR